VYIDSRCGAGAPAPPLAPGRACELPKAGARLLELTGFEDAASTASVGSARISAARSTDCSMNMGWERRSLSAVAENSRVPRCRDEAPRLVTGLPSHVSGH
jgi:hypothetical protein